MRPAIFLFLIWYCPISNASEQRFDCPKEIKRDTIKITSAPEGWTGFYPFEFQPGLPLNGAGLMWGPPSSMTISKPSWTGAIHGRDVEQWRNLGQGEKWMACFYGDNGRNDAILSRPIAARATQCTVTYPQKKVGRDSGDMKMTIIAARGLIARIRLNLELRLDQGIR